MTTSKQIWTTEQFKEYQKSGKKPDTETDVNKQKYGNKRTEVDNMIFDSQKEAKRYGELKLMHKAKRISKPIRQYAFIISEGIEYVADFVYFCYDSNQFIVEDVKGMKTDIFKVKEKMMLSKNKIEIKIT